jgi:uncharacterized protein with NRDE domain
MCTLSYYITEKGYTLFFNRDEQKKRDVASSPSRYTLEGVSVLAPRDGDKGGTWVSVNEYGVSICILNAYRHYSKTSEIRYRSRGLLVLEVSTATSIDDFRQRILALDTQVYRPFQLVAFSKHETPVLFMWDGRDLKEESAVFPLLSSSYNYEKAKDSRYNLYQKLRDKHGQINDAMLAEFHASHVPDKGPLSVCVHREHIQTVSLTQIKVGGAIASMGYIDGSPCALKCSVLEQISNAYIHLTLQ